jgi:hypothetical protein
MMIQGTFLMQCLMKCFILFATFWYFYLTKSMKESEEEIRYQSPFKLYISTSNTPYVGDKHPTLADVL